MPSPNHRPRASLASTGTGAAIRRGDLKISDPIPFNESRDMFITTNSIPSPRFNAGYRPNDTTWPRKSTSAQEYHVRHVSDMPPGSMSSIPSKSSLNQKKPGGLRATLKRMFTGRKHRSAPAKTDGYHYSDPGHLLPVAEQQPSTQPHYAPSFALVVPRRALTSHLTRQQPEDFDQSLPSPPRRRRRNTLPSLVSSDKDSGSLSAMGNRPSGQEFQDKKWAKEDYVSDGQLKRRSRSADALNEALRSGGLEPSPTRDRAGEIAYWRNSAIQNPVPVYSGQSITVDPVHVPGGVSSMEDSDAESSALANPMQAFDFGLDIGNAGGTTLEQRINTLEIKLVDFEYAIVKLQGTKISNPARNSRPDTRRPLHDIFVDDNTYPTLTSSSSHDTSYLSTPATVHDVSFLSSPGDTPPLSIPENDDDLFRPNRASKATTATITPYTARHRSPARSQSPTSIHIPLDKFEALLEMIKDEKAARQKLEEQVMGLQKEVDSLKTPVYATIREAYPTPSPESSHHAPATPRALHRAPGFQLNYPPPEISRFSGTDPESDHENEDEGFEEVYETPLEDIRRTFETAREEPRLVTT
ncbi:hypothetical protein LTR47_005672 [Exophiala xenobiotica]|nr:hypothetical protein LTR47_005672 [Exophiala xenobiotica]KAK5250756.1 hypothetical protein LTS06_004464 [Exophiala xenobiotica]KAK5351151.1 hypothetical protein LTR61_005504 [Exophiala xenobiotica]KAK5374129.1 hypothetical protein LTS03_006284 [Exophiala xenobiotica]KAK5374262.1 hypothetical protein LTR11_005469 [Exophiala xenobiotica]